jgi:hypothetical protein
MPSTPLISCSIGAAMVSAIVSGRSAGKCRGHRDGGGAISDTGRAAGRVGEGAEQVMNRAMTDAKIGRSMKKLDMFIAAASGAAAWPTEVATGRRRSLQRPDQAPT